MDASGQGCKRLAQAGCSGYVRRRVEPLLRVMRHLSGDAHELIAHYDRHETGGWRGGDALGWILRISYSAPYPWPGLDRVGVGDRGSQRFPTASPWAPPFLSLVIPSIARPLLLATGVQEWRQSPTTLARRVAASGVLRARSSFRFPSAPDQDIPHRAMQRRRLHSVAHRWMLRAEVTERPDARHRHSRGHHSRRDRF